MTKKKEFTQDIDVFFDHNDSILVCGTATYLVPKHVDRIRMAKDEQKRAKSKKSDPMDTAEVLYELLENYLRGCDIKVYQLEDGYKLDDYKESQEGLELLRHITDHTELGFYEFASMLNNQCMTIFGGVKLGKPLSKS